MKKVQIVYSGNKLTGDIDPVSQYEAECMKKKGFTVGIRPNLDMDIFLYRGPLSHVSHMYQDKGIWINDINAFNKTYDMTLYLEYISQRTFPSIILPNLDKENLLNALETLNCKRVFIKNGIRSLFFISDNASVYPDTSIEQIENNFNRLKLNGPYIIRKFINDKKIFYNEQRIWVLNGNPYSPYPFPDFIFETAQRLYEFSGSHYFSIDIAGDYIVEVNPGESSDRGGSNPLDWFCDIFAKEFLK